MVMEREKPLKEQVAALESTIITSFNASWETLNKIRCEIMAIKNRIDRLEKESLKGDGA